MQDRIDLAAYKRQGVATEARYTDERMLEYTRASPCIVPGCTNAVKCDADHQIEKAKKGLASDLLVLPICNFHHMELHHNIGRLEFEAKYGVCVEYLLVKHIEGYLLFIYAYVELTGCLPDVKEVREVKVKVPTRKTPKAEKPSKWQIEKKVKKPHESKYRPIQK